MSLKQMACYSHPQRLFIMFNVVQHLFAELCLLEKLYLGEDLQGSPKNPR